MANQQGTQVGAYIPTTNIWDVNEIYQANLDPKLTELLIRLYQNLNRMSLAVNIKESGFYPLQEYITSSQYFPNPANNSSTVAYAANRNVWRKTINYTTALPNTGTATIPHNIPINKGYTFTNIYATASDTSGENYIPIPYASPTLANNIEIKVDATNVYIITGSDRTNFNITYIVLEYIKF